MNAAELTVIKVPRTNEPEYFDAIVGSAKRQIARKVKEEGWMFRDDTHNIVAKTCEVNEQRCKDPQGPHPHQVLYITAFVWQFE